VNGFLKFQDGGGCHFEFSTFIIPSDRDQYSMLVGKYSC